MDYKKLINGFKSKEKRVENLIFLLVILIITLIIINNILDGENKKDREIKSNSKSNKIIESNSEKILEVDEYNYSLNYNNPEFEKRLEIVLNKIKGVSNATVLITYAQTEEIVPIYNENNSTSEIEEGEGNNKKITKEEEISKDIILDNSSNVLIQKKLSPKVEGAIIIANGVDDVNVKKDILSAVEVVTGLATHKIQVFEKGEN